MNKIEMASIPGIWLAGWLAAFSPAAAQGPSPELGAALQLKVQQVQTGAEKRMKEGMPPFTVAMTMNKLQPLLAKGKVKDALETADRALALLEKGRGLDEKIKRVQDGVAAMQQRGGNPEVIGTVMTPVEGYIGANNIAKAEKTVDLALKLLAVKDLSSDPDAQPYIRIAGKMKTLQQAVLAYDNPAETERRLDALIAKVDK